MCIAPVTVDNLQRLRMVHDETADGEHHLLKLKLCSCLVHCPYSSLHINFTVCSVKGFTQKGSDEEDDDQMLILYYYLSTMSIMVSCTAYNKITGWDHHSNGMLECNQPYFKLELNSELCATGNKLLHAKLHLCTEAVLTTECHCTSECLIYVYLWDGWLRWRELSNWTISCHLVARINILSLSLEEGNVCEWPVVARYGSHPCALNSIPMKGDFDTLGGVHTIHVWKGQLPVLCVVVFFGLSPSGALIITLLWLLYNHLPCGNKVNNTCTSCM